MSAPTPYSAAVVLRDALYLAMVQCDAPPCRISLSPTSATPIDICCDCGVGDGQAWVSMVSADPKYDEASGFTPCGFDTEVLFVMGISRCAHTLNDQGEPPTAAQLDEDAAKVYRDFSIMRRAIVLFVDELGLNKTDYILGAYDVHPLRGGCLVSTHECRVLFSCIPDPCVG